MNQISRFPTSGVCYSFSFRHSEKNFICSRCLGPHKFWPLDHLYYSTYESPLLKYMVRKRKNIGVCGKRLKETELLKVTNKQASQETMTVGKLNASLVTAFANEPGMILTNTRHSRYKRGIKNKVASTGELEKEQSQSHIDAYNSNSLDYVNSKRRVRYYGVIEDPKHFSKVASNDCHSHRYRDFYESAEDKANYSSGTPNKYLNVSQNSDVKTSNKRGEEVQVCDSIDLEGLKTGEFFSEMTSKDTNASSLPDLLALFHVKNSVFDEVDKSDQLILSLVDVCVSNGMLDEAFQLLHRNKTNSTQSSIAYDIVLKGFSEKGKWSEVQRILFLMKKRNVPASCVTFAIALDCLYRIPEKKNYKMAKADELLKNFQLMGYRIDGLFENTRINRYERENLLQLVRWFFPNFQLPMPCFSYKGKFRLVADLYDQDYALKSPLPFFTAENMAEAVRKQLTLETKSFCEVESVIKRGDSSLKYKKEWLNLIELWKTNLRTNFQRHLKAMEKEVMGKCDIPNLYPFLSCLPVEDFVNLMVREINHLCLSSEGFSQSTYSIYKSTGSRVWYRYIVRKKTKHNELFGKYKEFIEKYCSWYKNPYHVKCAREKWLIMMSNNPDVVSMEERNISWPEAVKIKVGKFIFDIILKSAIIPSSFLCSKEEKKATPAFYLVLRFNKGKITEQLKFHPSLGLLYRRANLNTLIFDASQLPMLCPPKPWTSVDSGGFYILPTYILRPTIFNYNVRMLRSVPVSNLYVVFDSLNQVQSIPWVVNEKVLDIALKIFREGGSKEINVPVYPDMSSVPVPQEYLDSNARAAAYRERLKIIQERQDEFGLWCECLYKLSLANHFRKKIFWLPHNMDFRGRVYPVCPHISHLGSDLYRSLLLFAKKEPLGDKGLDWLKVHAINLTGTLRKRPVAERLNHANEVLDDILDSAERPLDGGRWWTRSEDPWQTLATCFEIWNALHSRDPKSYATGFPVHQDGSCNGLQHYAALGRDSIGAASVNLKPAESPQDVYTVVANLIEETRKKDAREGVEIASLLEGFVSRKVIKQTVMTTVYGVTLYGAKSQIRGQLEDLRGFPQERVCEASAYLSAKVFEALKEMFTSAKEIQDWFTKCADIITGSCRQSVSWVTPLGLPVIQPYFKNMNNSKEILVKLLPDRKKQKNAFPPNFIHSLDSSHMMLTALYCGKAGLCFASVHDCFWTHPSHVDVMNKICREKFIALHSEEILGDLANHFLKTYEMPEAVIKKKEFMNIPKTGDFDLKSLLNSVYFFS